MQEVYWGVFSTATPVREWGKQEWARERMNCDTVATEGLGVPWKSLELSLPFEDVSNWGKATLPPTLPVIGLGWGDGLSAWGKQLFLARATPERYSTVNHQLATVPVTEGAEGEIGGGGGAPLHLLLLKRKQGQDKCFAADTLFGRWCQGARVRHRRVKKKEEKPVQRRAIRLFAALEDCCSMREISGALGSSAQKFLPRAITEKNLSIGSHRSRLAPWILNFPALLGSHVWALRVPRKGVVEASMASLGVEWNWRVSSTSENIWQNLKCKHSMIHKFLLQEFILEIFVFRGANIYVNLIGFGPHCLGWRPGSTTVNATPVNYVISHIGLLRVWTELKHTVGFEQCLAHSKVSMYVSYC